MPCCGLRTIAAPRCSHREPGLPCAVSPHFPLPLCLQLLNQGLGWERARSRERAHGLRGLSDHVSVFQAAKLAKMKIPPSEMFLSESDKYSRFDESVRIVFVLCSELCHPIG